MAEMLRNRSRMCLAFVVGLLLVVLICAAVISTDIASKGPQVIVEIDSISYHNDGTVRMKYSYASVEGPIVIQLGRRSGKEEFIYEEARIKKTITGKILGNPIEGGRGEGSFELGECDKIELVVAPLRIHLSSGEETVLAECRRSGSLRQLFVRCK